MILLVARVEYQIIRPHPTDQTQKDYGPMLSALVAGETEQDIAATLKREKGDNPTAKVEITGMEIKLRGVLK